MIYLKIAALLLVWSVLFVLVLSLFKINEPEGDE